MALTVHEFGAENLALNGVAGARPLQVSHTFSQSILDYINQIRNFGPGKRHLISVNVERTDYVWAKGAESGANGFYRHTGENPNFQGDGFGWPMALMGPEWTLDLLTRTRSGGVARSIADALAVAAGNGALVDAVYSHEPYLRCSINPNHGKIGTPDDYVNCFLNGWAPQIRAWWATKYPGPPSGWPTTLTELLSRIRFPAGPYNEGQFRQGHLWDFWWRANGSASLQGVADYMGLDPYCVTKDGGFSRTPTNGLTLEQILDGAPGILTTWGQPSFIDSVRQFCNGTGMFNGQGNIHTKGADVDYAIWETGRLQNGGDAAQGLWLTESLATLKDWARSDRHSLIMWIMFYSRHVEEPSGNISDWTYMSLDPTDLTKGRAAKAWQVFTNDAYWDPGGWDEGGGGVAPSAGSFNTGFEGWVLSTSGFFSVITNPGQFSIISGAARSGSRGLRCSGSSASAAEAIVPLPLQDKMPLRIAFRFTSAPTINCTFLSFPTGVTEGDLVVRRRSSDGMIGVRWGTGSTTFGTVAAAGDSAWHVLRLNLDAVTRVVSWSVDGTPMTALPAAAVAAGQVQSVNFGFKTVSSGGSVDFDDFLASADPNAHPLADGQGVYMTPNSTQLGQAGDGKFLSDAGGAVVAHTKLGIYPGGYADTSRPDYDGGEIESMTWMETELFGATGGVPDRRLAGQRIYFDWNDAWPTTQTIGGNQGHGRFPGPFTTCVAAGRIPVISVKSQLTGGTVTSYTSIANGSRDAQLDQWVTKLLAQSGVPEIWFIFQHEPNIAAPQGGNDSGNFKDAYIYIHDYLVSHGVTNLRFCWNPLVWFGADPAVQMAPWYPGNAYVDVLALDGYNDYRRACAGNPGWYTFQEVFGTARTWIEANHPSKPQAILETGLQEYDTYDIMTDSYKCAGLFSTPTNPTWKAQWLADMQTYIKASWPMLEMLLYFHQKHPGGTADDPHWYLDTRPGSLAAFRTIAEDVYFGGPDSSLDDLHTRVDDFPLGSTSDYVGQVAADGAARVKFGFSSLPAGTIKVNGVHALASFHSLNATGAPNSAEINVVDASDATSKITPLLRGDLSTSGAVAYAGAQIMPSGTSTIWDPAAVNALAMNFGKATDVAPNPRLDGLGIEVDIPLANAPTLASATIDLELDLAGSASLVSVGSAQVDFELDVIGGGERKFHSALVRGPGPGLGRVVHEFVGPAGVQNFENLDDWEAQEETPGGFGSAAGFAGPMDMSDFSVWRSFLETDGFCVWAGELLNAGAPDRAQLVGRGWGDRAARGHISRELLQTTDEGEWSEVTSDPIKWNQQSEKIDLSSGNALTWSIKKGGDDLNGNEKAGFGFWAKGQDLSRIAFTFHKSGALTGAHLHVAKVNEGPGNQFSDTNDVGGSPFNLGTGGLGDGDKVDITMPSNNDMIVIYLSIDQSYTGGLTNAHKFWVDDLRVNGPAVSGDEFGASEAALDIFAQLGIPVIDMDDVFTDVLPYDESDLSPEDALNWFATVGNATWGIYDLGIGPVGVFRRIGGRVWRVVDPEVHPDPIPLDRFSALRVPYKDSRGRRQNDMVLRPAFDSGVPDNRFYPLDLGSHIPKSRDAAENFGQPIIDFLATQRWGGSASLAEVVNEQGNRVSARHVRSGDALRYSSLNGLPVQVKSTSNTRFEFTVNHDDSLSTVDALTARLGLRFGDVG